MHDRLSRPPMLCLPAVAVELPADQLIVTEDKDVDAAALMTLKEETSTEGDDASDTTDK